MSDQTQEKENSLAELMVRILKEPLKPLGDSVKGLEGELTDIKAEVEHITSAVTYASEQGERAAKRRYEETLDTLRTGLTEHAQALAAMPEHLNEVLASALASLQAQLHEQQASLLGALAKWQTSATVAHTEQALSINAAIVSISQRLEQQQNSAETAQFALLGAMRDAAEHSQSAMAKTQQDGQVLCQAIAASQAEVLGALSQQAEVLSTRLVQSQAKVRQLTVAIGIFFVSMLAYVVYDLLDRP